MSYNQNNFKILKRKKLSGIGIEEKLIKLEFEKGNKLKKNLSYNNTISSDINNKPIYYSNVIQRQNTQSPNHSILLHDFVDDKKVAYKDITNRIDMNELSSKIKNIIINIQRIKSSDKIRVKHNINNNVNKKKPKIYHRKIKSSFSYRQSDSSFTTNNESKYSCSVKNIFVNENITYRNKPNHNEAFSFNLYLNKFFNNKYNDLEKKTYENEKYYSKTLREYLNEQVNNIKIKRYNINKNNRNTAKYNNSDHNYSIDNNKDIFEKKNLLLSDLDIDNLLIISDRKDIKKDKHSANKNKKKKLNFMTEKKVMSICDKKNRNLDEEIKYINNNKSNYLSFKKYNIKKHSQKKNNKKQNMIFSKYDNTFRNSNIHINVIKHKTMKNLNNNMNSNLIIINSKINKLGKTQCLYNSNLSNYISKPLKINYKLKKNNINSIKKNKSFKLFSKINAEKYNNYMINNENKNTLNICKTKNKEEKIKSKYHLNKSNNNIILNTEKIYKNNKFENKDKQNKRKNYSEAIRNKIYSISKRKVKVKNFSKKSSS